MKKIGLSQSAFLSFVLNILWAAANCLFGFYYRSWWFITIGVYYAVLASARFSALLVKRRARGNDEAEFFVKRRVGILLVFLSLCLVGIVILSAVTQRATKTHEIIMIAIAVYSFTRITLSVIGLAKARKESSCADKTLRNISFADALVSLYSLQRSMLVSFEGMTAEEIKLFNILTGIGAVLAILVLGINLIGGRKIDMAKSKISQTNQKIANGVVGGYKKIEKGVVSGYKSIEKGVVRGYGKLEDKFVEAYLTKEGESVEEAKQRLKGKKNNE